MNEKTILADWIKMNTTVTKVANDLKKSRPTIYKFIELFDNGQRDDIPEDVLAYFENCIQDEDSVTVVKMKAALCEKIDSIRREIEKEQEKIPELLAQKKDAFESIFILEHGSGTREPVSVKNVAISDLYHKSLQIDKQLFNIDEKVRKLKEEYAEQCNQLQRYDKTASIIATGLKSVYSIATYCAVEGNRCMIFHNGKIGNIEDLYVLSVYGKIGDEYVFLKEYWPPTHKEYDGGFSFDVGANYFIIDDMVLNAPLYYRIIRTDSGGFPGVFDETDNFGMCELKQSK